MKDNIFTSVPTQKVGSNTFDMSHDRKFSMQFGEITPCFLMECIPGDKINLSTSQMLRFAPLIAPVMHQVTVYTHFFFVPNRLTWSNWEDFITGGRLGQDEPAFPTIDFDTVNRGTLADYLGLPNSSFATTQQVSAMPFAAYQMVYNEYYRDQNLIDDIDFELVDGDNTSNTDLTSIRKRAWQHDYFTSALPFTQRGDEATIPLGTTADIISDTSASFVTGVRNQDNSVYAGSATTLRVDSSSNLERTGDGVAMRITGDGLQADLSNATASSIIDLRNAFKLQEWLEKNARGGSRYIENIKTHFNVNSSDARLQRPEFLGGASSPVTISEVLQTSANASEPTPQGNMAGHGISAGAGDNMNYFCEEHGYIVGMVTVMPKTAYQQGLPRHFRKYDKYDYYWPSFAHIGEQAINNWEIFMNGQSADDNVFGYTPRYSEYKFINSSVHGEFKSTLDFWHMGRIFSSRPTLNQTFIECNDSEVERSFAVTDSEKLYVHMYHDLKATRRMPYFGNPSM